MTVDPLNLTTSVTVVAGVASQALARRLRVPAIVPLLGLGILLGPHVLGIVQPEQLGSGLRVIVGMAVAIVLFEGGLTLKTEAFRLAGRAIRNLVTFGALITWALATIAAQMLVPSLDWGLSLLFGSLVVVTGPTVILPILHSIRPRKRVADVLRGEAILIDPIGALYAVLVLEYLIATDEGSTLAVAGQFGLRILLGIGLGAAGAFGLWRLLQRQETIAPDLRNLTVLSGAVGLYSLSESLLPESGVLTVTLAGFLLGWLEPGGIEEIEEFKGHVTTLMVSIVFILLAANLDLPEIGDLGWRGLAVVALIIVVVRPVSVFASTIGTDLQLREKLFLSWIAPRGIVAAAVASLFALILEQNGNADGRTVMSLTFIVIIGTVLLQGPTAGIVARWLGVLAEDPNGFLIIGASRPAVALGRALNRARLPVMLLDTNPTSVHTAREQGIPARRVNVLDEVAMAEVDLEELGYMLAMTSSETANRVSTRIYASDFGKGRTRPIRLDDSPEREGEQRGSYAFGDRLSLQDMDYYLRRGGKIEVVDIDEQVPISDIDERIGGAIPLLVLHSGKNRKAARFIDDGSVLEVGETLLYLSLPSTAPVA